MGGATNSWNVDVICDCGTKFNVPIGDTDLEALTFTCPNCKTTDKFTDDQIAQFVAAREVVVKELNRKIAKVARRLKN